MLTTINIPRINITRNGYYDSGDIATMIVFSCIAIAMAVIVTVGLLTAFDHHINPVRTVYKTKVVKINELTAAQNTYIKQCEQNDESDNNGGSNNGIPNVEVNPWTCTYAHQ